MQEEQLVSAIHSVDNDVTAKPLSSDQAYTELVPSQEITLTFTLLQETMEARNYISMVVGHYTTTKSTVRVSFSGHFFDYVDCGASSYAVGSGLNHG